jgi:hypothetical protein
MLVKRIVALVGVMLLAATLPVHAQANKKIPVELEVKKADDRNCYASRAKPQPYQVTCGINLKECNDNLNAARNTRPNAEYTTCSTAIHCFGYNNRKDQACYSSAAECDRNSAAMKGSACKATTASGGANW